MRISAILYFFVVALHVAAAEPAGSAPWTEEEARYRFAVHCERPDLPASLRLGDWLFPGGLGNGVVVTDENGEPIPFVLHKENRRLIIAPHPTANERFVYYGFASPRTFKRWDEEKFGKIPAKYDLTLKSVKAWMKVMSEEKRAKSVRKRREREIKRHDTRIGAQEKHIARARELLDEARGRGANLEENVTIATRGVRETRSARRRFESVSREAASKRAVAENEFAETEKRYRHLVGDRDQMASRVAMVEKELAENRNRLEKSEATVKSLDDAVKMVMTKMEKLGEEQKRLSNELVDVEKRVAALKRKITAIQKAKNTTKSSPSAASNEPASANVDPVRPLRDKLETAAALLDALRNNARGVEKEMKDLKGREAATRSDVERAEADAVSAGKVVMKLESEFRQLSGDLASRKRRVDDVQLVLAAKRKTLANRRETETRRKRELSAGDEKVKLAESALVEAKRLQKDNRQKVKKLEQRLENAEKKRKELIERKKIELDEQERQELFEKKKRQREPEKFFKKPKSVHGEGPAEKIELTAAPFGRGDGGFAARFSGELIVREEGEFEFAINSDCGSCLMIDGEMILAWEDEHDRSEAWEKTATVKLAAGLPHVEFYYQKNKEPAYAAAAWRRAGEEDFKILTAENFAPGWPTKVECSRDREGERFPKVSWAARGVLYLDDAKVWWGRCEIDDSEEFVNDARWTIGGDSFSGPAVDLWVPEAEEPVEVTLTSTSDSFPAFPLNPLPFPEEEEIVDPEILLRIWTPSFIFDDETLSLDVEARSGLPHEVIVFLECVPSRENDMFPKCRKRLVLKGKSSRKDDPFAPAFYLKERFHPKGEELMDGLDVRFTLDAPGARLAEETIRFAPLRECVDLTETATGLRDGEGRIVIPVLHRKTLSEIRSWSFPGLVMSRFLPPTGVLVVADDFSRGDSAFSDALRNAFADRGVPLEFVSWKEANAEGAVNQGLPGVLAAIRDSKTDSIVIIPSSLGRRNVASDWHRERLLAAVLQAALEKPNIRDVRLCVPMPLPMSIAMENPAAAAVQRLAREYGIGLVDLDLFIRTLPDWRTLFQDSDDENAPLENWPVQAMDPLAEKIVRELLGQ